MLASGRPASDRVFATGSRADQFQDKPHRPSVTYRVTRTGDEDSSIINVTYPCSRPEGAPRRVGARVGGRPPRGTPGRARPHERKDTLAWAQRCIRAMSLHML